MSSRAVRLLILMIVGTLLLQGVAVCQGQQTETRILNFEETKAKAEKGDTKAQFDLGLKYEYGEGVNRNYGEALKWFRKAAEQGHAGAQCLLSSMYATGFGVKKKDVAEAVKWHRKAAEQGNPAGQNSLGLAYQVGHGVNKDYTEAAKWFRKAAEQGYEVAQANLGWAYYSGNGVKKDYVEAHAWFNLAASGYQTAVSERDNLEKQMSPQQIADAQKRTKELRTTIESKMKHK